MLGRVWDGRSDVVHCEQGGGAWRRTVELDGDRAAVVDWGCGGVWELRETRAVLKAGSARAERLRRCGATVSFELAGVRAGRGGVLGFLGRELVRE